MNLEKTKYAVDGLKAISKLEAGRLSRTEEMKYGRLFERNPMRMKMRVVSDL
jgi:hypothetical protein